MLLADVAMASQRVAATRSRREKTTLLATLLRALAPGERPVVVSWLTGEPAQGRIGLGWAAVREALDAGGAAAVSSLTVDDVHAALGAFAAARGPGSSAARRALLGGLFGRAAAGEREFLAALLTGELRQGALEGLLLEAVAQAAGAGPDEVRRATMLAGSLPAVATAVLGEGPEALQRFRLRLFSPVQPMLAQPADGVAPALAALGRAALEWKLDGARVQVHRRGEEVRVYTRALRDVTAALPEVVAVARAARAHALVLDGEALAVRPDRTPSCRGADETGPPVPPLAPAGRAGPSLAAPPWSSPWPVAPFQVTMRRFGRRVDVERLAPDLPLTAFFFDVLHRDGEDLLAWPYEARHAVLEAVTPPGHLVPRIVTDRAAEAEAFLEDALGRGQEGLVAKALDAPYEAGRRGGAWLKVKRARTLDLVVLAVEPGSGRRRGWLSNLHLGARDPAGGFAMLGKTFKGMTDAMLAWQTERLRALAVSHEGNVIRVRPELVVEVAFDGVQASPRYESGLALRFARVRRYREDKRPEDADTIEAVRSLYQKG